MNLNTQNSVGLPSSISWEQIQNSGATGSVPISSKPPSHLATKSEAQQQLEAVQYFAEASLGVASSLLLALAAKHRPTAMHSIRVALGCSGWAKFRGMSEKEVQELEIAAALHDLGKIGVSDSILSKPEALTPEESFSVESNRQNTLALLSPSLVNKSIAETIYYSIAHFDGSKPGFPKRRDDLPIASRMLTIVDAFDSMTTTSHYRAKMNNSEAIAELFSKADVQFDRSLVVDFSKYVDANNIWTNPQHIGQWLQPLSSIHQNSNWSLAFNQHNLANDSAERNYQKILLETCSDGVAFLDINGKILLWNRMAENITGLPASDMFDRHWSSDVLDLKDDFNQPLVGDECPVLRVLTRKQTLNVNTTIRIDQDERRNVELQVVPVFSSSQVLVGVAVVMNDVSSEQSLRQKLKSMTVAATIDPLTQVANRHEFDRVYEQVIACHREENSPFSVIFTDIDFFKRINDDYSHQAGDEALSSFAAHLTRNCRPEDMVSRFGGEEFVILCANSDIQAATERAEAMRSTLQALPQKMLKNRCITASFGVAQLQDGDTGESLLRRADRALLKAKKEGRNRVVSLSGVQAEEIDTKKKAKRSSFFSWLTGRRESDKASQLDKKLVTSVPLEIVIEKIRGFVSDFGAEIKSVQNKTVVFAVNTSKVNLARREGDRACQLLVSLRLDEYEDHDVTCEKTMIYLNIKVSRAKDRRVPNLNSYLEDMYRCLKSYLVAYEYGVKQHGTLERAATKPGRREN